MCVGILGTIAGCLFSTLKGRMVHRPSEVANYSLLFLIENEKYTIFSKSLPAECH